MEERERKKKKRKKGRKEKKRKRKERFRFMRCFVCLESETFTYLSSSVHLVGEFDLVEGHGRLHPVSSEVWRVGVYVDAAVAPPLAAALRPPGRHPLPVHELPAAAVGRHEVQQEGVHGAGVETGHADLQDREHPAAQTDTQTDILVLIIDLFKNLWFNFSTIFMVVLDYSGFSVHFWG